MDSIIGKKLDGRYEIQEIIGIGGMAVVYKAYDSIDDRIVAVKVLKEEYLKNDDFRRRFKNESKAVAVLSHPNIVKVYDVSFGERIQYIVMEFIDGITLKEYIDQQKTLTWKEAVHFTVQILRALSHAHERDIVHRDIKPQNIMMLEDGTIKVTDFGIARFAHSETKTMTDKAIGSVHYISPEQARGSLTDAKSDIYSVGVMLYEMLTGDLPFEADSAVSVAIMQMQEDPRQPRTLNPDIPEGLEEITLHAMQKDPEQRYKSASEMLDDIERFKRNPSIHFQYKYFVDDSPTKYIDAIKEVKGIDKDEEGEAAIDKKTEKGKNGAKGTKKTNLLPILAGITAALVVVVTGLILATLATNNLIGPNGGDVTVPNLVNMEFSTAQNKYAATLNIHQDNTAYDNTIAAGKIISQATDANTTVKKNATVNVVVSLGKQKITIPTDIIGATEDDAKTELAGDGFTNVVIAQKNDEGAIGTVISSLPTAGKQAAADDKITLYVSLGPAVTTVTVPDLSGLTSDEATRAVQDKGLVYNIIQQYSSTVKVGYIISQTPTANTPAPSKSTVYIYVSKGPQKSSSTPIATVQVPYVVGDTLSDAEDEIKRLKLKCTVVLYAYNDDYDKNCVYKQGTKQGTYVKVGTVIKLYVSIGSNPASETSSADTTSSQ